jgi:hypothetical protein
VIQQLKLLKERYKEKFRANFFNCAEDGEKQYKEYTDLFNKYTNSDDFLDVK